MKVEQIAPGYPRKKKKGQKGQDEQKESILVSICECVAKRDNGLRCVRLSSSQHHQKWCAMCCHAALTASPDFPTIKS